LVELSGAVDSKQDVIAASVLADGKDLVAHSASDDIAVEVPTVAVDRQGGPVVPPDVSTDPEAGGTQDRNADELQRVLDSGWPPIPGEDRVEGFTRQ
jgi:hypothetical protein